MINYKKLAGEWQKEFRDTFSYSGIFVRYESKKKRVIIEVKFGNTTYEVGIETRFPVEIVKNRVGIMIEKQFVDFAKRGKLELMRDRMIFCREHKDFFPQRCELDICNDCIDKGKNCSENRMVYILHRL